MVSNKITAFKKWLEADNYKSFYLSFLRVTISLWFLKELCFNWSSLDILYGHSRFVVLEENAATKVFNGGFHFLQDHYQIVIGVYIIILLLNITGTGRWISALLLFIMVDIIYKMNMTIINGGDNMARAILLYLVFADTYQYFVLSKQKITTNLYKAKFVNLLSNLAAFSIMFQLCLAYLMSAISKIDSAMWYNGEAVYYSFLLERFRGTSLNNYLVQSAWFVKGATYFTFLFELLFPVLVWIKKTRSWVIFTGILFHLGIYIFMMIYGFQVVFILIYGLFFTNEEWLRLLNRWNLMKNK